MTEGGILQQTTRGFDSHLACQLTRVTEWLCTKIAFLLVAVLQVRVLPLPLSFGKDFRVRWCNGNTQHGNFHPMTLQCDTQVGRPSPPGNALALAECCNGSCSGSCPCCRHHPLPSGLCRFLGKQLKFKNMKKIYVRLGAVAAVLLVLVACAEAPQPEDDRQVVGGDYDRAMYAKKVSIGKHEYFLVYASCDGRHSVHRCKEFHGGAQVRCFLHHSPDCPCRKALPKVDVAVTDEGESTDPFNW